MRKKTKKSSKTEWNVWSGMFFVVSAFCVVILPLIQSEKIMDQSLMPRMLAWILCLTAVTLLFFNRKIYGQAEVSVLQLHLFKALVLYFLISLVSLFFAHNMPSAYFDLVKTFSFILFLSLTCLIFYHTPDWQSHLTKIFLIAAIIGLFIGFSEYFSKLGLGIYGRIELKQVKGLMSNINMYTSYLMLTLPFLVYGVFSLERIWKKLSVFTLVFSLILITLLQTRAVYLGILAGSVFAGILIMLYYKHFYLNARIRNIIGLSFLGLFFLLASGYVLLPDHNPLKVRINQTFTDTDNPRIRIWDVSLSMIRDHPLTGVGAGNFHIRLSEYAGEKGLGQHGIVWMRPHNDFLWVATEKGIPGLLTYLAVFVLAFYYARALILGKSHQKEKLFVLLIFAGLIAYMVNAFFDFPLERINQQITLAIYLAGLMVLYHQSRHGEPGLHERKKPNRSVILVPLLLLCLLGSIYTFQAIKVEKQVAIARKAHEMGHWNAMLVAALEAQTSWRNIDPIGNPVVLYECLAYMSLNNIPKALEAGEKAFEVSPGRRTVLLPLGYLYLSVNQHDKAKECIQKIIRLYPSDHIARTILGQTYYQTGEVGLALETLEKIPPGEREPEVLRMLEAIRRDMNASH